MMRIGLLASRSRQKRLKRSGPRDTEARTNLWLAAQMNEGIKDRNRSGRYTEVGFSITKLEVVQQMVLNYLQDASSADDGHLFARWDDPKSQKKFMYYLARMKSKEIVRDSGTVFSLLTRDSVKKITLALGQKDSFFRGFDMILHLLLESLLENSPVISEEAQDLQLLVVEGGFQLLGNFFVLSFWVF